jgi:hypothetical protein
MNVVWRKEAVNICATTLWAALNAFVQLDTCWMRMSETALVIK